MDPEHRGKNNNAVPRKKADIKIQSTVFFTQKVHNSKGINKD